MKVRLGSVLEEFKAKPPTGSNPEVLTLTERNGFVRQADRFTKRLATEDVSGYKYIELDDFAFNPYLLWAGAIARNGRFANGVISPLYPTFRVTPGNYAGYVERLVLSQQLISAYDNIAFGSVPRRRRSSVKDFLALEVPALPPLDEQRRIAAILDKADELRTKRREALTHLDTLTQSIFHSMFPKRGWTGTTLGAVAEFRYGSSNKSGSNGYECLRIPNVAQRQIDWTEMKLVPVNPAELNRLRLRSGDLLFVRSNGNPDFVGRSAVFEPRNEANVIYASYLIRARFISDSPLMPFFVNAYLGTAEGRDQLRSGAKTSAGQYNINTQSLGALTIPVPPLELQQTFATRVAGVERLKELHRKHLAELDALFSSLQHRAFKGEL